MKGSIPPKQCFLVRVKYSPTIVSMLSNTTYVVKVNGGNEERFTCTGSAIGMNVYLSSKSINFGEISQESSTNRLLNIVNDSDSPAHYQFLCDKKNIFSFSKVEGVVPPKSSERIIILFRPNQTVNYYERIFCMVRNHKVLYVDLLGTCFDILTKPLPLM